MPGKTEIDNRPETGPKILFFTGGTALYELSRSLTRRTHNSVHVVSPFDSGGSSAALRRAFAMPAVGDLRSRLLALADHDDTPTARVVELLAQRFPADEEPGELASRLGRLCDSDVYDLAGVSQDASAVIRGALEIFRSSMPDELDLGRASVGNLVLVGLYLREGRDLEKAAHAFAHLVTARGRVTTVADDDVHLAAELADGTRVIGQHALTGKETAPLASPIVDLYLVGALDSSAPVQVAAAARVCDLIATADLICFPMGSFYTSVLANLLPTGVGRAVRMAQCPKVYVANTEPDPEQVGMQLRDATSAILRALRHDAGDEVATGELLTSIILDRRRGVYGGDLDDRFFGDRSIEVLDRPLVSKQSGRRVDAGRLAELLMSLAGSA